MSDEELLEVDALIAQLTEFEANCERRTMANRAAANEALAKGAQAIHKAKRHSPPQPPKAAKPKPKKSTALVTTPAADPVQSVTLIKEPSLVSWAKFIKSSDTGLEIDKEIPWDDWKEAAGAYLRIRDSVQWFVGDILNFGEHKYGEVYAQVVQETGYGQDTIANICRICAAIEPARRVQGLHWSLHRAVAGLTSRAQQDKLLAEASANKWTVRELESHLGKERKPRTPKDQTTQSHSGTGPASTAGEDNRQTSFSEKGGDAVASGDNTGTGSEPSDAMLDATESALQGAVAYFAQIDPKSLKPLRRGKWLKLLEQVGGFYEALIKESFTPPEV